MFRALSIAETLALAPQQQDCMSLAQLQRRHYHNDNVAVLTAQDKNSIAIADPDRRQLKQDNPILHKHLDGRTFSPGLV